MPVRASSVLSTSSSKDAILAGILVAYIDDLCLGADDEDELLRHIERLVKRADEHNVRFNLSKCKFGYEETEFLGQLISEHGRKIDPARIQALKDMKVPDDPKTGKSKLLSFLGLCSYYRDFIPFFHELEKPFEGLREHKARFVWTQAHTEAFHRLKDAVVNARPLAPLDFRYPFVIHTDASDYGIGGVLLTGPPDSLRPAMYFSRKFTTAELKWPTIEKEGLALHTAVAKKFYKFLRAGPFIVRTDHMNLLYMEDSSNPRVQRWHRDLIAYEMHVEHVPGETNVVADGLSRVLAINTSLSYLHQVRCARAVDPSPDHFCCVFQDVQGHVTRETWDIGVESYTVSRGICSESWDTVCALAADVRANRRLARELMRQDRAEAVTKPSGKGKGKGAAAAEATPVIPPVAKPKPKTIPRALRDLADYNGAPSNTVPPTATDGRPRRATQQHQATDETTTTGSVPPVLRTDGPVLPLPTDTLPATEAVDDDSFMMQLLAAQSQMSQREIKALKEGLGRKHFKQEKRGNALVWVCTDVSPPALVIPSTPTGMELQKTLQSMAHEGNAHLGVSRTIQHLTSSGVWWRGMRPDVAQHVRSCPQCQRHKPTGKVQPVPDLRHVEAQRPFEVVQIDIIGPLPPPAWGLAETSADAMDEDGDESAVHDTGTPAKEYILCCVDKFSGFAVAVPIEKADSEHIIDALAYSWVGYFGLPDVIQHDGASHFTNGSVRDLLIRWRVHEHTIDAYNPRSNGAVERVVGEIQRRLRTQLNNMTGEWRSVLPMIMLTHNTSVNASTGYAPADVILLHTPRTILSSWTQSAKVHSSTGLDRQTRLEQVLHEMR